VHGQHELQGHLLHGQHEHWVKLLHGTVVQGRVNIASWYVYSWSKIILPPTDVFLKEATGILPLLCDMVMRHTVTALYEHPGRGP
jgi:hypothetical protein